MLVWDEKGGMGMLDQGSGSMHGKFVTMPQIFIHHCRALFNAFHNLQYLMGKLLIIMSL